MQKPHFFLKFSLFALAVGVVCVLISLPTDVAERRNKRMAQVYQRPISKRYVGQVLFPPATQRRPAAPSTMPVLSAAASTELTSPPALNPELALPAGIPTDNSVNIAGLDGSAGNQEAAEPRLQGEPDNVQHILPDSEPDSEKIVAPVNTPGLNRYGEKALVAILAALQTPTPVASQPEPDTKPELVYALPATLLAESDGMHHAPLPQESSKQAERAPALEESPAEHRHTDLTHSEVDGQPGTAPSSHGNPKALAAYGSSSEMGSRTSLAYNPESSPVAAYKSVTSINRTFFAPLGMYQLAVGGMEADQIRAPGESRFSRNFDFHGVGLRPSAGVYWYSEHYTDYHFSPSSKEIERGGLIEQESLQDYSPFIGLTLDVNLTRNWTAFINGEITMPGSRIRGNALTGSHNEAITTGIIYTFN